jgi:rod shape-determining protein MreD
MNWAKLLAVLLAAVLLQTTLGRLVDVPLVEIDLPLILVLVCGLISPTHDARLAGLLVGGVVDLLSGGPMGVNTFAFGFTALAVTKLRETINRHMWLGRLLIALLAALTCELVLLLHLHYLQGADLGGFAHAVLTACRIAVPAALAAALLTLVPALAPRRRRVAWGH